MESNLTKIHQDDVDEKHDGEASDALFNSQEQEISSEDAESKMKEFLVHIFIIVIVFIGACSSGMAMGFSGILLPQLNSTNGTLRTDEEMGSWIASIVSASTPIGSMIAGLLVDCIGRKLTLHLQSFVVILGWILVAFSENHGTILCGRFISGVASGIGIVSCQVFVAEVSLPNMRGVLGSIPFLSYSFGILLVYAFGSVMHWKLVSGVSASIPIIVIILYFILPESHVWLLKKGKLKRARKACLWYRGNNSKKAEEELQQITDRIEKENSRSNQRWLLWKSLLTTQVIKPFVIIMIFNFLQTLSGIYLIVFYAVEFISQIKKTNVSNMFAAVLTASVRMIFTIVGCILLAFVDRRSIALFSGIGTCIFSLIFGIILQYNIIENNYVSVGFLLCYIAAHTMGLLLLPLVMMGELFPTKARGFAGGLSYTIYSLFIFGTTKIFPFLKQQLDISGMFLLFGISSLILTVFVVLMLPETKGRTLNEIEDYFLQDNLTWIGRDKSMDKKEKVIECRS